jgi:hypothetical protein
MMRIMEEIRRSKICVGEEIRETVVTSPFRYNFPYDIQLHVSNDQDRGKHSGNETGKECN